MNKQLILLVGLGGALGASARFGVSVLFAYQSAFPFATLLVNLLGCFLLAYSSYLLLSQQVLSKEIILALNTGFIGSFTTFSTFSLETISLWQTAQISAVIYVFISISGGLAACLAGYQAARWKGDVHK